MYQHKTEKLRISWKGIVHNIVLIIYPFALQGPCSKCWPHTSWKYVKGYFPPTLEQCSLFFFLEKKLARLSTWLEVIYSFLEYCNEISPVEFYSQQNSVAPVLLLSLLWMLFWKNMKIKNNNGGLLNSLIFESPKLHCCGPLKGSLLCMRRRELALEASTI